MQMIEKDKALLALAALKAKLTADYPELTGDIIASVALGQQVPLHEMTPALSRLLAWYDQQQPETVTNPIDVIQDPGRSDTMTLTFSSIGDVTMHHDAASRSYVYRGIGNANLAIEPLGGGFSGKQEVYHNASLGGDLYIGADEIKFVYE